MRHHRRALLAVIPIVLTVGCSSDGDAATSAVPDSVAPSVALTVASSVTESGTDESTTTAVTETVATSDTVMVSDTGAVVAETAPPTSANGEPPVMVDGEAPPERTFTLMSGSIEPASLQIAVGDNVTFVVTDGTLHSIAVGGLDDAAVLDKLSETFEFHAAGTYTAVDRVSGTSATIIVG
jgi:plastocyanin